MRLGKENRRHSREGGNPVSPFFFVESTGKEPDPRLRGGDENPNPAINKFNNLRPYLSAYGADPPGKRRHPLMVAVHEIVGTEEYEVEV